MGDITVTPGRGFSWDVTLTDRFFAFFNDARNDNVARVTRGLLFRWKLRTILRELIRRGGV